MPRGGDKNRSVISDDVGWDSKLVDGERFTVGVSFGDGGMMPRGGDKKRF